MDNSGECTFSGGFSGILMAAWIFLTPYDIPGQRRKKETPLDILKKRFARGEITKEEFEEKKQFLENY
jgi:putative membrane protein